MDVAGGVVHTQLDANHAVVADQRTGFSLANDIGVGDVFTRALADDFVAVETHAPTGVTSRIIRLSESYEAWSVPGRILPVFDEDTLPSAGGGHYAHDLPHGKSAIAALQVLEDGSASIRDIASGQVRDNGRIKIDANETEVIGPILVTVDQGALVAYRTATLRQVWKIPLAKPAFGVTACAARMVCWSSEDERFAVDPFTGEVRWTLKYLACPTDGNKIEIRAIRNT